MKILDKLFAKFGYTRNEFKRDFAGGLQTRLTSDWVASITTADSEIKGSLKTMRARCRDLERNNDYARRYLKLVRNNVLGSNGIGLQSKVKETVRRGKKWVEEYDRRANKIIEDHWWRWGQASLCTRGRQLTWVDAQHIALGSAARDGSILVRFHYPNDTPYHFRIDLIEADHLDIDYQAALSNGTTIRMGKEYGADGQCVAFHILRNHPGEQCQQLGDGVWRERVPKENILHLYLPDRVNQSEGYPWLASAILGLKHLGAYSEAEVVAARMGASKMGFLVQQAGAPGPGFVGATDGAGNKYMEVEPGSIEQLPYGYDFKSFDPNHPNTAFSAFVKSCLRGIAAGLGVSYTSLANDLEAVNYSSIRAGLLEEREEWKTIQGWFISWFVTPIFEHWLESSLAAGALSDEIAALPAAKFDKFNSPEWKPRRWGWVDPLSDLQAQVLAVEKGFKSRRELIAENGGDIEVVFSDIAADEALEDEYGLDFDESDQQPNDQQSKPDAPDDPTKPLTEEDK